SSHIFSSFFISPHTATTDIYTLSLHDALPIFWEAGWTQYVGIETGAEYFLTRVEQVSRVPINFHLVTVGQIVTLRRENQPFFDRSEEHTSELQSQSNLVCRLLLEKKKNKQRS